MDNILKTKLVQLKEHFNFQLDVKNIQFYKRIKTIINKSIFIIGSFGLAFLFSILILNGFRSFSTNFWTSAFFIPFFSVYLNKINIKFQPQFTRLSSKLPKFLRILPFIKSAEDSFFFSRDNISKMLVDKNCQLVFYEFFNMAKNNIYKFDDQKIFTQQMVIFKSCLESANYVKAADYFIELYATAHQFEYMIYDDYQTHHDIQMLKTRKILIDDFLHQADVDDFSEQAIKSKSISLTKDNPVVNKSFSSNESKNKENKVNWKKLMDD